MELPPRAFDLTKAAVRQPARVTYRLPDSLCGDDDSRALRSLRTYYGTGGRGAYTGSYFNAWGREQDPDRFSADDLIAVSFLSVYIPAMAARAILQTEAEHFDAMLRAVGPDRDLSLENEPGTSEHPAWRLEMELRRLDGVGRTKASKLCARKRPRLFPIYDSVIGAVTGVGPADPQWEPLRAALRADEGRLSRRLERLRTEAGIGDDVSVLRVYDVICWMEGKDKGYVSPAPPIQPDADSDDD
ncbi:DUF6308 family protein [Blastococcus sp. SYSU D00695]